MQRLSRVVLGKMYVFFISEVQEMASAPSKDEILKKIRETRNAIESNTEGFVESVWEAMGGFAEMVLA